MTIPEDRYRDMRFMPSFGGTVGDMIDWPSRLGPDASAPGNRSCGPIFMPNLSGIDPHDAERRRVIRMCQAYAIDFDRWYTSRPVREEDQVDWPRFDVGMGTLERDGINIPYFYDLPRTAHTTGVEEALRREIAGAIANEMERHHRVAFERALMRRAIEAGFRRAYMGRQPMNMRRAYYGVDWTQAEAQAYLNMFPTFEDEEQAREWFESMGAVWPTEGPNPWSHATVSKNLKGQARTLRERAFARVFQGLTPGGAVKLYCDRWEGSKAYELDLKGKRLRNVMAAARRDPEARGHLATLPISWSPRPGLNANDELVDPLQDLADIVVHEITLAYEEEYYPRPVGVGALTDEHVTQVMKAMQREINRENRGMRPAKLEEDLPWERQVALAERRRNWFARFGITPRSWRTGRWSLWKVPNEPFPEGYSGHDSREIGPMTENDQDEGLTMIGPAPDWTEMMRAYTMRDRALPSGGRIDTIVIDDPFGGSPFPANDVTIIDNPTAIGDVPFGQPGVTA